MRQVSDDDLDALLPPDDGQGRARTRSHGNVWKADEVSGYAVTFDTRPILTFTLISTCHKKNIIYGYSGRRLK